MVKKQTKKDREVTDKMFYAIADFIKHKGGNVVVIGSPRVQKQPGDLEFNYEFVVRFTGKPPTSEHP